MRVHGNKVLRRRTGVDELKNYRDAKRLLMEDFQNSCGYCGKNSLIMHERFHIDHFVPLRISPERETDYYNLVWSCPKCNQVKSGQWPTEDKDIAHDESKGFIDPALEEYDQHIERNDQGYIQGKTLLGENICKSLNFHMRRTDLYWNISRLYQIQQELEKLFDEEKLDEDEKNYYIKSNRLLKQYLDDAFAAGE